MAPTTEKNSALNQFRKEQTVDKMRRNHAPMAEERKRTVQLLQKGEEEMEAYGTEIDQLHEAINQLHAAILTVENQKRELAHHMIRTRSLLTPIRTLPVEVLSHIFCFYVVNEGGNTIGTKTFIPASTLSLVCKHWQNVALWTRELWSIIHIELMEGAPASIRALKTLIARSSKTTADTNTLIPLDLTLFVDGEYDEQASDAVLDTIISHSSRWRSLTVGGWPSVLRETMFQAIGGRLQQLETLVLNTEPEWFPETDNGDVLSLFQDASLLRTVDTIFSNEFHLPWSQLSTLSFRIAGNFSEYLTIFQSLAVVAELSIFFQDDTDLPPAEASEPLQMPCQTLHLDFLGVESSYTLPYLRLIFSQIQCSKLETLSLISLRFFTEHSYPLQSFNNFLLLSQPPLRCLHLERVNIDSLEIQSSLVLMQMLEELTIIDVNSNLVRYPKLLNQSLLNAMSAFREVENYDSAFNGPCLLPRLTKVSFTADWQITEYEDQHALARMLQSRCIPETSMMTEVSSLKSVTLRSKGIPFVTSFVQQMRHLRSSGLKMTVQDTTGWPLS